MRKVQLEKVHYPNLTYGRPIASMERTGHLGQLAVRSVPSLTNHTDNVFAKAIGLSVIGTNAGIVLLIFLIAISIKIIKAYLYHKDAKETRRNSYSFL